MSFILTLSSFYWPIDRMAVFAAAMIATYVFSLLAEYILTIHPPKFGRMITACISAAKDDKLVWTKDLIGPYFTEKTLPELIVYTCLIFALTILWLVLWIPRGWRNRKSEAISIVKDEKPEEAPLPSGQTSQFGSKGLPFPTTKRSPLEWIVGTSLMVLSLGLTGIGAFLLDGIFEGRRGMILTSNDKYGENLWGIGQIAALFVWAPLLVEMGYTAVSGWKSRPRRAMS